MATRASSSGGQGDALRRAKALSAPTRVAVLDQLRAADGPITAQEIAADLGIHHTAVRQHLTVLTQAGLVAAVPQPPSGRGRPKVAYRPLTSPDPYQHLAVALADALASHRSPLEAGRRLGAKVHPASKAEGPLGALVAEAERLGFRPRVRDRAGGVREIVLQHCPFADVASDNPEVVCELHKGLAEGVLVTLDELFGDDGAAEGWELVDLKVADPHKAGCRLILQPIARG